jgi:hypothetical protein
LTASQSALDNLLLMASHRELHNPTAK